MTNVIWQMENEARLRLLVARSLGFGSEKSQKGFALRDLAVRTQPVVIRQQRRLAAMFDDYDAVFGEQVMLCHQPHDGRVDFGIVRRIEIDDVELGLFRREVLQRPNRVAIDHPVTLSYSAIAQVLADDSSGFERRFDECDVPGAA